jgi:hypothetical protein
MESKYQTVQSYRDNLSLRLFKYLKKKGRKCVNENYYEIKTFIDIFLGKELLELILKQQKPNIASINLHAVYQLDIPTSLKKYLFYFINNNGDIERTFDYYHKSKSTPIISSDSFFPVTGYPESKIEIETERNIRHEPRTIILRMFKNTSLNNLSELLNKKEVVETIKHIQSLPTVVNYPYKKQGKVDFYQKIVSYIVDNDKKQAKKENIITRKKVKRGLFDITDTKAGLLPDTDEQIAAKALGNDKYYKLKNVKKGSNLVRVRRKRLADSLKSS